MISTSLKRTILLLAVVSVSGLAIAGVVFAAYLGVITHRIGTRMEQLKTTRSSAFYAFYPEMLKGQQFRPAELRSILADQGFVERKNPEELSLGEYSLAQRDNNLELTLFRPPFEGAGHVLERLRARLDFQAKDRAFELTQITALDSGTSLDRYESVPKKVAAYYAGRLRTQNAVTLSEIPVSMRLAVIAIEDVNFLEHIGVSFRGTIRALLKDVKAGKFVEGGSTITQQLMKNLFFSREKSITRKIKEILYAFVTEARHSKEDILESYLNEVYLGQRGPHEIHGVSEGARYYFNRPISQLTLAQSATLAAIIQAPNAQDPHRFADKTTARRNLVLRKMLDAEFILKDEFETATTEPLGVTPSEKNLSDVDYAIDLVLSQLPKDVRARLDNEPLAVYTTLNPMLQSAASEVLAANIARLGTISKDIRKREQQGMHVQGALVSVDVKTCSVLALQGGRSYRQTQFNRVLQGRRQPGSLFKPFVFLAGFNAHVIAPDTLLEDAPFEWKYEGNQTWSPRNYDKNFRGPVTTRQALELSLNVPTARAAEKVGIGPIRQMIINSGVQSPIPAVPSISLGSADVTPFEMANAYTTFANLGNRCSLRAFSSVFDSNRNLIAQSAPEFQPALPPAATFQTVNVMKGVFSHGTARAAQSRGLPLQRFAGKSGTTNENKDAWFMGFSPDILALVWLGYDEELELGLTGSAASLPTWADFMEAARPFLGQNDFVPPDGVREYIVDRALPPAGEPPENCLDPVVEYFLSGTEPRAYCKVSDSSPLRLNSR